jgi:ribosomal protein S18 acetylase RimI-like enzyme
MRRNPRNSTSQLTASSVSEFSTKQLSIRTWRDFERLFETHPAPGTYPCWCMYNHRNGVEKKTSRAIWVKRNHRDKRALVDRGRSHGILVYSHGEPVGWCQYGLMKELPRIDNNPKYRKLASASGRTLWRITCFVVHKNYRRRGVARTALRAALAAIQEQGGGLVEAYPIKPSNAGELTQTTEERYPCSRGRGSRSSHRSAKAMC